LGAQNIVKEIKQYQEKWLQHVQKVDTNRLPKQALQYKPKGRRNIGRPRKRWRDQLHLEDQGTGNTSNPSGTLWWWWHISVPLFISSGLLLCPEDGRKIFLWNFHCYLPVYRNVTSHGSGICTRIAAGNLISSLWITLKQYGIITKYVSKYFDKATEQWTPLW